MNPFDKTDDPRRRLLIKALAAGFFTGAMPESIALAQEILGGRPSKLPPGKSIYRVEGDVKVDGAPASLDTKIGPRSTVETAGKSEVVFVSPDQKAYIVRSNSRVILETAQPDGIFSSGLRLVAGALLSVFPRGSPVQLKTKTATVGIRGTGVYMEADPEQTYLCTCYGVTDVVANDDPESRDTVAASHHDRPLYILSGASKGKNIRRGPFINHTDQELMLVETLVGRTPPFVFPKDDYSGPRREY